jgi:hypothetical protein
MTCTMLANQPAAVAADARPCDGLGLGHQWMNLSGAVAVSTYEFMRTISTTKRPARHLGGQPT